MGGFGTPVPPGVRMLLFANILTFLATKILLGRYWVAWVDVFGLSSWGVLHGRIWQLGTYLFLHGDFVHLLFNMFYLYMFGSSVERALGRARFLQYYFITGVGAAVVWTFARWMDATPTVGASGAIYGLLLAFGVLFANATVLLFFIIPMRAAIVVAMLIGVEVLYMIGNPDSSDGIAHAIHLAGAAIGFVLLRRGIRMPPFLQRYRRWRMRRKLQVIDYRELMKFDDDEPGDSTGRGTRA